MTRYLALALLATACGGLPSEGPHYESLRHRLSEVPTWFYVHDEDSTAIVTARRRGANAWVESTTSVVIEHGNLRARLDESGQLAIDRFELALAPVSLEGVLASPASLKDVRLRLADAARGEPAWTTVDDAAAEVVTRLDFDWAIAIGDAEPYPLATGALPPLGADVLLAGDGNHVEAKLAIEAAGELWTWADLVEVTGLTLSLHAETES